MTNSSLSYRYGFAVYHKDSIPDLTEINDWKRIKVSEYVIHFHPEVNMQMVETKIGNAIIIGDAYVCKGKKDLKSILELMLKKEAWSEFDNITGRFALILISSNNDNVKILHDPFGSRTVYYRQNISPQ
ncbi:hypothetical protein [Ornithinibacillus halophilus]|uniref:Glutamine amidotransferase type-2 domain-containing protein n=1 Tax=Ornithinibacillus halophilus TaxID=930117 RepID=A0A1M5EA06_9BACI|nr:hypothetical protein [Ornithinibacillus halophilus]SHF75964.1 hypothetical protein SAMN05216225_100429 [Ornithinibacillus halophilus]